MTGWRSSLIVHGVDLHGSSTPVVVGIVDTETGAQLAIRVGEDGETIILPVRTAAQLIVNLREALAERFE